MRIECASCHKSVPEDPDLSLTRVNVKGVSGVFLCQWCIKPALSSALCPRCHGNGVVTLRDSGGHAIGTAVCPACRGKGRGRTD